MRIDKKSNFSYTRNSTKVFVNPVLKMIAMVGIMSLIALPVYSLDVREFKFQKSSTVAMISSSDIISEFEVTFSVGSALIHCADSCAQSTFCAGIELCETTPKVCRLWGTEFSVQWVNQSVPQCQRFQKVWIKLNVNTCKIFFRDLYSFIKVPFS